MITAWRGGSMTGLPSSDGGHGARHHLVIPDVVSEFLAPAAASTGANKRKRRPAGTPDPGAEVVALSPKTLMESDRYVCEICNQGFQRDQNLQMHRRRHKVPWKLLKKPSLGTHKRVYVCPERSCLHHNPAHALGDLVGIKKHYRRKHCTEKQWKCDKCSKRYAVQSDYKAHLKTCGTRGHCCDCGRVFSRVESFIEHQDTCNAVKQTSMQLFEGAASERNLSLVFQEVTHRNSHDSPSQSSNTTQAMSFEQSGMSERSADSTKVPSADDVDHSRSILATQALTTSAYNATAMPAWLMDRRGNELELLQPPANSAFPEIRPVDHGSSRSLVCSINSAGPGSTLPEDVNTPSLQLSIGPYEGASFLDTKPILRSVEKEALALACQQGCSSVYNSRPSSGEAVPLGITTGVTSSRPHLGNDLVLSIRNQGMDGPGTEAVNSLTGFLVQAAARRIGPASSNAVEIHQLKKQTLSRNSEMVVTCNPRAAGTPGSNSSFHEDRAGKIHDSEASGIGVARRGTNSHHARPELATSMVSSWQALDLMDVDETDQLFAASHSRGHEGIRSQKQLTAARVESNEACEQAPDTNTAWTDVLTAARRTRDQARQESDEAQRELAHADRLRREAHEQLQLAYAERAYAEAELAKAQRLREHAQAELERAHVLFRDCSTGTSASSQDQGFPFCDSCKSAIGTRAQGVDHRSGPEIFTFSGSLR